MFLWCCKRFFLWILKDEVQESHLHDWLEICRDELLQFEADFIKLYSNLLLIFLQLIERGSNLLSLI